MAGENSVAALEEELAFQGETLASLNAALATQQQDILLLKRQLALLGNELRSLRTTGASSEEGSADPDDKPPHY